MKRFLQRTLLFAVVSDFLFDIGKMRRLTRAKKFVCLGRNLSLRHQESAIGIAPKNMDEAERLLNDHNPA